MTPDDGPPVPPPNLPGWLVAAIVGGYTVLAVMVVALTML